MERDIKIATVYKKDFFENFEPYAMDTVRWVRISESLSKLGFKVDIIVNVNGAACVQKPNLRYVSFSQVNWDEYYIVKALYHTGYVTLMQEGVDSHPFIISRLASVVASRDDARGVHFFAEERDRLYEIQRKIHQRSRFISLTTEQSKDLWEEEFGEEPNIVLVPTGVDRIIPRPVRNPYRGFSEKIAVYIGNIRRLEKQREVNLLWQQRLNSLGRLLKKKGVRLCFVGVGDIEHIDQDFVTCLGPVRNDMIWDYEYFADAGIALAQGEVQNHDSSKIYYYLRAGLPVVSESPIPNNHVIRESNLGLIANYGDDRMMADMVEAACKRKWEKKDAIRYIVNNHTWDKRAGVYERLIKAEFGWLSEDTAEYSK